MCITLVVDDEEIDTPAGMAAKLGCSVDEMVVAHGWPADVVVNACLCQIDIEETLNAKGIAWTYDADFAVYTVELNALTEG